VYQVHYRGPGRRKKRAASAGTLRRNNSTWSWKPGGGKLHYHSLGKGDLIQGKRPLSERATWAAKTRACGEGESTPVKKHEKSYSTRGNVTKTFLTEEREWAILGNR